MQVRTILDIMNLVCVWLNASAVCAQASALQGMHSLQRYGLHGLCSMETSLQFDILDPKGVYHSKGYPYLN